MLRTPHIRVPRVRLGLATLFSLASLTLGGEAAASLMVRPQVIAVHPHDPDAFTQGLLFFDGELYESTGLYGESTLRRVALRSGEVLQQHDLPMEYFGEGLALVDQQLIQLTWQEQVAFVYDRETFEVTGQFAYEEDGWGLTFDGTHLIMSDGWVGLIYRDPATFELVDEVQVVDGINIVTSVNELEYVDGIVYANVGQSQWVFAIDPETGNVLLRYDCTELVPDNPDLNGIAYDPATQHFFLTGKNYPSVFEVSLPSPHPEDAPPSVAISSPSDQAQYSASESIDIEIMADDGDGLGVAKVELLLDDQLLLTRERELLVADPWVIPNADFDPGEITLRARAYDAWGNVTESAPVTVFITEAAGEEAETGESGGVDSGDDSAESMDSAGFEQSEAGCACVAASDSRGSSAPLALLLGLFGLAVVSRGRLER